MRVDVVADAQTLVDAVCAECKVPAQSVLEYWDAQFEEWALAADSFKCLPEKCKVRLVRATHSAAGRRRASHLVGGQANLRLDIKASAESLVFALCKTCKVQYAPDIVVEYWDGDFRRWAYALGDSFMGIPGMCELRLLRGTPLMLPPPLSRQAEEEQNASLVVQEATDERSSSPAPEVDEAAEHTTVPRS